MVSLHKLIISTPPHIMTFLIFILMIEWDPRTLFIKFDGDNKIDILHQFKNQILDPKEFNFLDSKLKFGFIFKIFWGHCYSKAVIKVLKSNQISLWAPRTSERGVRIPKPQIRKKFQGIWKSKLLRPFLDWLLTI